MQVVKTHNTCPAISVAQVTVHILRQNYSYYLYKFFECIGGGCHKCGNKNCGRLLDWNINKSRMFFAATVFTHFVPNPSLVDHVTSDLMHSR